MQSIAMPLPGYGGVIAESGPKVYRALLTQSGTDAPVATVLENSLGAITWMRDDMGKGVAQSSGLFTASKTIIFATGFDGQTSIRIDSDSEFALFQGNADGWTASIQILVYP